MLLSNVEGKPPNYSIFIIVYNWGLRRNTPLNGGVGHGENNIHLAYRSRGLDALMKTDFCVTFSHRVGIPGDKTIYWAESLDLTWSSIRRNNRSIQMNRKGYDLSIEILKKAVNQAKIGYTEKLKALTMYSKLIFLLFLGRKSFNSL